MARVAVYINYKLTDPVGINNYLDQMIGPPPRINISVLISKTISVSGFVQFFHQME